MKVHKIRPKFHFLTKIELKMTHLVFLFCYLLKTFGSCFINIEDSELLFISEFNPENFHNFPRNQLIFP